MRRRWVVLDAVAIAAVLTAGIVAAVFADVGPVEEAAARPDAVSAAPEEEERFGLPPLGASVEGTMPPAGTVAVTFDDGPSPRYTPRILDILDRHEATATFFVLGQQAEKYPDLVREIVDRGHAVQNHSWNHRPLPGLDADAFDQEVTGTNRLLTDLTGVIPTCVRPPRGETDDAVADRLARRGLAGVLWTVDTEDWLLPGAGTIAVRASAVRDQGVIVLHDGGGPRDQTVAALPPILEDLGRRGLGTAHVCGPSHRMPPPLVLSQPGVPDAAAEGDRTGPPVTAAPRRPDADGGDGASEGWPAPHEPGRPDDPTPDTTLPVIPGI